jgi:uncharacterized protein YraI
MNKTLRGFVFVSFVISLFEACVPGGVDPDNDGIVGVDESTSDRGDGLTGSVVVGQKLITTANLNLRSGASTSYDVLHVIPEGSTVFAQSASPNNGFYKVKHSGVVGWSYGDYLKKAPADSPPADSGTGGGDQTPSDPPPTSNVRDLAMERAGAGIGFSYWWGHGRFKPAGPTTSTAGSCSGSCPDCSHSGSWGGDCSGFVAKVWQVPSSNDDLTVDSHPYSTADFAQSTSQWTQISRSNLEKADAMNYRSGGSGHIFVYEKGDPWGSLYAYECKGCSAGCTKGYRTASSSYKAIRKKGW